MSEEGTRGVGVGRGTRGVGVGRGRGVLVSEGVRGVLVSEEGTNEGVGRGYERGCRKRVRTRVSEEGTNEGVGRGVPGGYLRGEKYDVVCRVGEMRDMSGTVTQKKQVEQEATIIINNSISFYFQKQNSYAERESVI